jgi:AraC-like DNA-binding protein
MGWISVVFAHKVVAFSAASSDARRGLLPSAGVDPDATPAPEHMIDDGAFFGLLERLSDETAGGRDVALRVGASMRCDDYGAFGLAFKSAVDLASAYHRVERYGRVVTSIANFRVVHGSRTARMEVIAVPPMRPGLRRTHELALAAAAALSREVSPAFSAVGAHFTADAPEDPSAFAAHFDCPLHFGAPFDALEVHHEQLQQPNRVGDAAISRFFDAHLDGALAELPEDGGLARRVGAEIAQALSEGVPSLQRVAARLGMSGRTLQRRLGASGVGYKDLVAHTRRELAERLLRRSDYGLAEVAFLTGFSDQSTFTRAFKRWSGQTPREYRLGA